MSTSKSGIYIIKCLVDNKVYIGQSISIRGRLGYHRRDLKKNKHSNSHLQSAWNKYGKDNFTFEILEVCTDKELNEREIYYINNYQCNNPKFGYNFQDGGTIFCKHSDETKRKMQKVKPCKRVYGFRKSGEFYKEWNSIKECARDLSVSTCDVRRTISQKQLTCKSYVLNDKNEFRLRESLTKDNIKNLIK